MSQQVRCPRWPSLVRWPLSVCGALLALALVTGGASESAQAQAASGPLVLHFLDVGDGDATWLSLPDGETALVNCGPASASKQLALRLKSAGIVRLDQLIITQTRANAVAGCVDVLGQMVVGSVTWSGLSGDPQIWGPLQSLIQYYGIAPQVLPLATPQSLGGAAYTAFQRPPDGTADDQFDSSVVLLIEYAGTRTLLPGAIHANGESNALHNGLTYPIHIIEVPDGGSTQGSSSDFLQQLFRADQGSSCRAAIFSQGADRRGAASASSVKDRFSRVCPQMYVTAENGSVVAQVAADGSAPRVSSEH